MPDEQPLIMRVTAMLDAIDRAIYPMMRPQETRWESGMGAETIGLPGDGHV